VEWLKKGEKGVLLRLYVQPDSLNNEFSGLFGDRLKCKITAPPIDGKANKNVVEFLSRFLNISKSKIHIMKGLQSRNKDLLIQLSLDDILKKFESFQQ